MVRPDRHDKGPVSETAIVRRRVQQQPPEQETLFISFSPKKRPLWYSVARVMNRLLSTYLDYSVTTKE